MADSEYGTAGEEASDELASLIERARVEQQARGRYVASQSRAQADLIRYERNHKYYAPLDGDQWPDDRMRRAGKLHVTANIVRAFVDTEARLLSIPPRITNKPDSEDPESEKRAELVEDLFLRWLEASRWDTWGYDLNRIKGIYGIGYLKPVWNEVEKRPDVRLIEQPQNLRIGWGSNDFSVIDWALYAYELSPLEAKIRWPGIEIQAQRNSELKVIAPSRGDHQDPLNQRNPITGALTMISNTINSLRQPNEGEYESRHVEVWDYWYRELDGSICNAVLVQGTLVDGPHKHPEYPAIPYIPIEHDHEPGTPVGMSTAELLIDPQMGLNRALSQMAQYIADETETAYQLTGDNADSIPPGIIPKAGEIVPAGAGNRIEPISKGVNQYPSEALISQYWQTAHKITGLSEILFGSMPGSQTSGRAVAVQIEAAINRLYSKRVRYYEGLRNLMLFWGYMVKQKNPSVTVTQTPSQSDQAMADPTQQAPALTSQKISIADVIEGMNRWRIVPPEITPKDVQEHSTNVANMVNAKLMPLEMAMDEVGIESPKKAIAMIESESSNARLFPERAQAYAAVQSTLLSIMQMMQQSGITPGQGQAAANNATGAQATAQQAAQEAAPTLTEDQNQAQPATMSGSAPPPGSPSPLGGKLQMLVRQTPGGESQSMSQIALQRQV